MQKMVSTHNRPLSPVLNVLGGLTLCDGAGQPIELKARKSRQLLAYLAVPAGQARTRDQLAALLWSDRQDEQARASLRTALSGIRRAIGDDALIVDQDMISLRPGCLCTDYDHLRGLVETGKDIATLNDFYGGDFLAGFEHDSELFMAWLRTLRAECNDLAVGLLKNNADRLAEVGQNRGAIDLMRASLSLEPLREQTHRTIMRLYVASGERALALTQFKTCAELLSHELDTTPGPETQALADSIALQNPDATPAQHQRVASVYQTAKSKPRPVTAPTQQPLFHADNAASVVVLPFANMSGDAEQNYFADGITEDIITDLSGIGTLSVASRSAGQVYRGADVSPSQIAQDLGVHYLLEGSVRKFGNSVRISAQLIDAQNNRQIWAERFDRTFDNIFELQSEISQAIVMALDINLTPLISERAGKSATTSAEAYQCYLRGRNVFRICGIDNYQLAYELFQRAVDLDPDYAQAYAGLGNCAAILTADAKMKSDILDAALKDCNRALDINPTLAEGYAARGHVYQIMGNTGAAKQDYEKAILLNPMLDEAHFRLGKYYLNIEENTEKAFVSFKKAYELGDRTIPNCMMLQVCLRGLDYPQELRFYARQVLDISKKIIAIDPHHVAAAMMIAFSHNDLGETAEAIRWAEIAQDGVTEDGTQMYNIGCLYAQLGEIDKSLAALERCLILGRSDEWFQFMKVSDHDLAPVRKDPRFGELVARFEH